jgi:hypothetical protein
MEKLSTQTREKTHESHGRDTTRRKVQWKPTPAEASSPRAIPSNANDFEATSLQTVLEIGFAHLRHFYGHAFHLTLRITERSGWRSQENSLHKALLSPSLPYATQSS